MNTKLYYDYKSEERFSRLKILCVDKEVLDSMMNSIEPKIKSLNIKID